MHKIKIEIKWGIIFAAAGLLWMLLERLVGLHGPHIDKHAIYTNIFAIPAIAIYLLALLDKRNNFYNGIMTYKQGLISGLIITLIVTILSPLTQYITSSIITPEYFPNIIDYTVEQGKMTRDAAEAQFNLKNYIVQGLIGAPLMGIVTSAIVAIFTRKK
jgi:hypothetical protein